MSYEENFLKTYTEKTYKHTATVSHKGTVIAFALDDQRRIYYTVLALDSGNPQKSPIDAHAWLANPNELFFPIEVTQVGYGVADQTPMPLIKQGTREEAQPGELRAEEIDYFLSTTARFTADAPFQVFSDDKFVYLFRQSIATDHEDMVFKRYADGVLVKDSDGNNVPLVSETLLVDRYVLSGTVLLPKREVRFRRSRSKTRPYNQKDSLGDKDMENRPFIEPTQELAFVNNLRQGRFAVLLLPTQIASVSRWQIFCHNSRTGSIDSWNVERFKDGLFNPQGTQFYTSPDPQYQKSVFERSPGIDPFTGQELVPIISKSGYAESALRFDGDNDYVALPDMNTDWSGGFTVEAWVYYDQLNWYSRVINFSNESDNRIALCNSQNTGKLRFIVANGSQGSALQMDSNVVETGRWLHVAATINSQGTAALYVDGELKKSGPLNLPPKVVRDNNYIGASIGQPDSPSIHKFEGKLDELRLWNRARSQDEIKADMNHRLVGNEPGLVGYWRFDEGSGTIAYDQTEQANHGTISNPSWVASDAPVGDHPGIRRTSFKFADRAIATGLTALLYYQQETGAAGYDEQEKPLKRNARVMLAAGTLEDPLPSGSDENCKHIAVLDFAVSRDGRLAQVPDNLQISSLEQDNDRWGTPNQLLDAISNQESQIQTLLDDLAGLESAIAPLQRDIIALEQDVAAIPQLKSDIETQAGILEGLNRDRIVTFYDRNDFSGDKLVMQAGEENPDLRQIDWNDRIGSLRLSEGVKVEVYENTNYGGNKSVYPSTDSYGAIIDTISSIKVLESAELQQDKAAAQARLDEKQASLDILEGKLAELANQRLQLNQKLAERQDKSAQLAGHQHELAQMQAAVKDRVAVPMPLLHVDPFGLTVSGGLLTFAYTKDSPQLFSSATGKLALYFRGLKDQFFSAYYDTHTTRSAISLETRDSADRQGSLALVSRAAEAAMDDLQVTVSDGPISEQCQVTITNAKVELTETWTRVPRAVQQFAAVLNGTASAPIFIGKAQATLTRDGKKTLVVTDLLANTIQAGDRLQLGDQTVTATSTLNRNAVLVHLNAASFSDGIPPSSAYRYRRLGTVQAVSGENITSLTLTTPLQRALNPDESLYLDKGAAHTDNFVTVSAYAPRHASTVSINSKSLNLTADMPLYRVEEIYHQSLAAKAAAVTGSTTSLALTDPLRFDLKANDELWVNGTSVTLSADASKGTTTLSINSTSLEIEADTPLYFRHTIEAAYVGEATATQEVLTRLVLVGISSLSLRPDDRLCIIFGFFSHISIFEAIGSPKRAALIEIEDAADTVRVTANSPVYHLPYDYDAWVSWSSSHPVQYRLQNGSLQVVAALQAARGSVQNTSGPLAGFATASCQWVAEAPGSNLTFNGQQNLVSLGTKEVKEVLANLPVASESAATELRSALQFNGTNDYVELADMNIDWSGGFTVEAWIWYDQFNNQAKVIDFGTGASNNNIGLVNAGLTGKLLLIVFSGGNRTALQTDTAVLDTRRWLHVAATIEATGDATLYVDGQKKEQGSVHVPPTVNRTRNYVGRSNWSSDGYFQGKLDELRVWNRARTEAEIQQDKDRRLSGQEPGLVGYWHFENVENGSAQDYSGNGHHGTLHGSPSVVASPFHRVVTQKATARALSQLDARGDITLEAWANPRDVTNTANLIQHFSGQSQYTLGLQRQGLESALKLNGSNHLNCGSGASLNLTGPLTVEAWIAPATSFLDNYAAIVGNWSGSWISAYRGYYLGIKASDRRITWWVGGDELIGSVIPANTWTHVAATFDGSTLKIYVNGSEVASRPRSSDSFPAASDPLYIGSNLGSFSGSNPFVGSVDEVRIWNFARDPDDIQQDKDRRLGGREPGLVGYWQFDSGLTKDYSGHGNDGAFVGSGQPEIVPSVFPAYNFFAGVGSPQWAAALEFDGQNDYVNCGPIDLANTSFTIEFWAKRGPSTGQHQFLIGQGLPEPNQLLHAGFRSNNQFTFAFFNNDLNTDGTYDPDGDWNHWACSYNKVTKEQRVYLNGTLIKTRPNVNPYQGTGDFYLGQQAENTDQFSGQMAEVRIWDSARSEAEIEATMNRSLTGKEDSLISYWRFSPAPGNVAIDLASHGGNHGSIHGCTPVASPLDSSAGSGIAAAPLLLKQSKQLMGFDQWEHLAAVFNQSYALQLDGNDYLRCEANPALNIPGDLTLELFLAPQRVGSEMGLLAKGQLGAGAAYVLSITHDGKLKFVFEDKNRIAYPYESPAGSIQAGQFYRIAVTRKQTTKAVKQSPAGLGVADVGKLEGSASENRQKIEYNRDKIDDAMRADYVAGQNEFPTAGDSVPQSIEDLEDFKLSDAAIGLPPGGSVQHTLEVSLYINGQIHSFKRAERVDSSDNRSPLEIGRIVTEGTPIFFAGAISEVRLWNTARAANEVGQPIQGQETGLISWWRMEENEGNVAYDAKSQNHAAIAGATWTTNPDPNGSSFTLYRNGTPIKQEDLTDLDPEAIDWGRPQFSLGGKQTSEGVANAFQGTLEEVRIWKVARTQEQILDNLFTRLKGEKQDLLAYYTFDIEDLNELKDHSLLGNHLPFIGGDRQPNFDLSTAPISNDIAQVRSALSGVKTQFHDTLGSRPAIQEYSDLQYDSEANLISVMKRCYGYIKDGNWHLLTGYKVGNIITEWVSQVQSDPHIIGYIEGAPPVPSENLTSTDPVTGQLENYIGASYVELEEPEGVNFTFGASQENSFDQSYNLQARFGLKSRSELGFIAITSIEDNKLLVGLKGNLDISNAWGSEANSSFGRNTTRVARLELRGIWENKDKNVDAEGFLFPGQTSYLNTAVGRRFIPYNIGIAVVQSETMDLFALRLAHNNALVAYNLRPNPDIPKDWNLLVFPINPTYTKQGTLDGKVGVREDGSAQPDPDYPNATTYAEWSYFKPKEAYALKRQIELEQQELETYYRQYDTSVGNRSAERAKQGAEIGAAVGGTAGAIVGGVAGGVSGAALGAGPVTAAVGAGIGAVKGAEVGSVVGSALGGAIGGVAGAFEMEELTVPTQLAKRNLVNTYVWTVEGGFFSESTEVMESLEESSSGSYSIQGQAGFSINTAFNLFKVAAQFEFDALFGGSVTGVKSRSKTTERSFSLDVAADADSDITLKVNTLEEAERYPYFNQDEGKGAFDELGNPIFRPGKVNAYRFMTFYLQPDKDNFEDFFNKVVDPIWLEQSDDPNAMALRQANQSGQKPACWRIFHRVTFVSRILPEIEQNAPPVESALRAANVESNWQLLEKLKPFVRDKTHSYVEFADGVRHALETYLPELLPHEQEIIEYAALYFGLEEEI